MSFFTAVLASDGTVWRARDVDVEGADDLDDLAISLRSASHHDHPVLAVIEAEDLWFALVRADGDEDVRLFVSDLTVASRGHYGPVVAPAADADVDLPPDPAAEPASAQDEMQDEAEDEVLEVGAFAPLAARTDRPPERPGDLDDDVLGEEEVVLVELPGDDEPVRPWAGDPALLEDLGVTARDLVNAVEENPDDPSAVLADLGERVGFAELIEALR